MTPSIHGKGQMGYKAGVDKQQLSLMPVCIDDYISENHICRLIEAFTGQLDMSALGFKYAERKETGCRPYDPRMMLNLYIYGYLHRVRSSRRLEGETKRNIEVMWLMNELKPDDKTICNFRTDNAAALKKLRERRGKYEALKERVEKESEVCILY